MSIMNRRVEGKGGGRGCGVGGREGVVVVGRSREGGRVYLEGGVIPFTNVCVLLHHPW